MDSFICFFKPCAKLTNIFLILCAIMFMILPIGAARAQQVDTLWFEDFEGDWINEWHVDAGTWEVGEPSSGPGTAFTGDQCAATVLSGNYSEWVNSRLIRHVSFVVPTEEQNPRLRFWHWYSFSADDKGFVEIKVGSEDWQAISPTLTNTSSGCWSYASIDLRPFAGKTVQVGFRFISRADTYYSGTRTHVSSGWYLDNVCLITGPSIFRQLEDWETGIGDWSAERGTWQVGEPVYGPNSANSGTQCAATVLDGNYHEWVDSRLVSPEIIIPDAGSNPRLRFWHWYRFSSDDKAFVEVKTGDNAWQTVSAVYTNTSSYQWTYASIDLSAYAGQTVRIAFRFVSRADTYYSGTYTHVSSGWYVDDISIITGPVIFKNPEDWETGIGDWAVERGTWQVGRPTKGPSSAYTGTNCAATVLEGNYEEWVDSRLVSPKFSLKNCEQSPALIFWHWYSFSSDDNAVVQLKTDNTDWITISNDYVNTSSGTWTNTYFDLAAYTDSTIQIAFRFMSRANTYYSGTYTHVSTGWYIDDVRILGYRSASLFIPVACLDFEEVMLAHFKDDSVIVSNTGNDTLHISAITLTGPDTSHFYADTRLFSIAPSDSQYILVRFNPDSLGELSAFLNIDSDGGNSAVELLGTGIKDTTTALPEIHSNLPKEYHLKQNYPNPFNPETTIHFGLPEAANVKIDVFNNIGQKVAMLVNEHKAAGHYDVTFNAGHLASGVYIYRLATESGFSQTRKMIFIR